MRNHRYGRGRGSNLTGLKKSVLTFKVSPHVHLMAGSPFPDRAVPRPITSTLSVRALRLCHARPLGGSVNTQSSLTGSQPMVYPTKSH